LEKRKAHRERIAAYEMTGKSFVSSTEEVHNPSPPLPPHTVEEEGSASQQPQTANSTKHTTVANDYAATKVKTATVQISPATIRKNTNRKMIESDRFQSALQKVNIAMNLKTQNNHKLLGVNIYDSLPAAEDEDTVEPPPSNNWADEMENESIPTSTDLEATYIDRPPVHNNRINVEKNLLDELLRENPEDLRGGWKPDCLIPFGNRHIRPDYPDWLNKPYDDTMVHRTNHRISLTDEAKFASHHFLMTCAMIKYIWETTGVLETDNLEDRGNLSFKYKEFIDNLCEKDEDSDTELVKACCDGYNGTAPRLVLPITPSELWINEQFQKNWATKLEELVNHRKIFSMVWRFHINV
jgi:hypothetical protein